MYQPALITQLEKNARLPIDEAALLLAEDSYPTLSVASCRLELDRLAAPMRRAVSMGGDPADLARLMALYIHDQAGFRGNAEDYEDPRNCFLSDVIDRRLGIPISLTILWMALGRRVGVPVAGVAFPGHFLARVGGPDGVLVDPYYGGRIVPRSDLKLLLRELGDDSLEVQPAMLRPVSTHSMVIRLLLNLKDSYELRGDYSKLLLACDRLVDLTGAPEHRRDRGVAAYHLGSYHAACHDLEAYLTDRADADDAWTVAMAAEQARARADSNLQ